MFRSRILPALRATRFLHPRLFITKPFSILTTNSFSPSRRPIPTFHQPIPSKRFYASQTHADTLLEQLQDQYATARDEFEIASEETEKKSVYAEADREAAREELDKLKKMYEEMVGGEGGEEVRRRVGQRLRELESAVVEMERMALEE